MAIAIRPIFSDAALKQLETDWSITAVDAETGITVTHQDVYHDSELTFHGGIMGDDIVRTSCTPATINTIATLIIDGLKAQFPGEPRLRQSQQRLEPTLAERLKELYRPRSEPTSEPLTPTFDYPRFRR